LLCGACEHRFNDSGEDWVLKNCWLTDGLPSALRAPWMRRRSWTIKGFARTRARRFPASKSTSWHIWARASSGERRYEVGRVEILQGTLDLLILRTLRWGPAHGHAIAKAIERGSDDVLLVEQGSL
jgi:hypothetical protein